MPQRCIRVSRIAMLFALLASACSVEFGRPVPTARMPIVINDDFKHTHYSKGDSGYFQSCNADASRAVAGVPTAEALVRRCWSNRNLELAPPVGALVYLSMFGLAFTVDPGAKRDALLITGTTVGLAMAVFGIVMSVRNKRDLAAAVTLYNAALAQQPN